MIAWQASGAFSMKESQYASGTTFNVYALIPYTNSKPFRHRAGAQQRLSAVEWTARESLHMTHSSTDKRRVRFSGGSLERIDHWRDVL